MKSIRLCRAFSCGSFLFCILILPVTFLPGQKMPIAVLDFQPFGISETEAIALTNRLRNELFRVGSFKVVERGMMESILEEQDFQLSGCTSDECLVEVGRLLGARQMVGGSISKVAGTFTVSARMVDVETGEVLSVSDYDLRGELDDMLTHGMRAVVATLVGSDEKLKGPSLKDIYKPQDDSYKGGIQASIGFNEHLGIGAASGALRRLFLYSYHLARPLKVRNRALYLSLLLTHDKLEWSSSDHEYAHQSEGWSISLMRQWRFVYLRTVGHSYSAGMG